MASKIRILNERAINQIAAGEVIENSASVVKELVENALDAGARQIGVEIKAGGRQLIRITDDGCGMSRDDAVLSLERHATSKIREADDLRDLITMGFRGEALSSIAAISKMSIITCEEANVPEGTLVIIDGGKIIQCTSASRSRGTTIEVKSLFYNVPVRKEFQKSIGSDRAEIYKIITAIALARPDVQFQLVIDEKEALNVMHWPNEKRLDQLRFRIGVILGKELQEQVIAIDFQSAELKIQGFLGGVEQSRSNRTGQYLFINQRAVNSPFISEAVREGYGTRLPSLRYPYFVLHVELPPSLVDVNVHPQKREVRFREEQQLQRTLSNAIMAALSSSVALPISSYFTPASMFTNFPVLHEEMRVPFTFQSPIEEQPAIQEVLFEQKPNILTLLGKYAFIQESSLPADLVKQVEQPGESKALLIMDIQAAYHRITYEQLLHRQEPIPSQILMIPYTLELSPAEANTLQDYLELINDLGVSVRSFGGNAFLIDSLPAQLEASDPRELLMELIFSLKEGASRAQLEQEKTKKVAAAVSKAVTKRRGHYSLEEISYCIDQLLRCGMPGQCPQGKPIFARLSDEEIAKKFSV